MRHRQLQRRADREEQDQHADLGENVAAQQLGPEGGRSRGNVPVRAGGAVLIDWRRLAIRFSVACPLCRRLCDTQGAGGRMGCDVGQFGGYGGGG